MGHYWWLPSIGNVYLERPPWCKQVSFGTFFALVKLFSWKEKNFVYSIWGKKSFLLFHSFCWFYFSPSSPFSLSLVEPENQISSFRLLVRISLGLRSTRLFSFWRQKKKLKIFLFFFLSYFFEAGGAWRTKVRESGFTVQRFGGEEFLLSNDLLACCFYFFFALKLNFNFSARITNLVQSA